MSTNGNGNGSAFAAVAGLVKSPLLAAVLTIGGFAATWSMQAAKVAEHAGKLKELEQTAVRREEFDRILRSQHDEAERQFQALRDQLSRIEAKLDRTNDRIDRDIDRRARESRR